mgnify:CR=1 FL=1
MGVGIDTSIVTSSLKAIISAINRSVALDFRGFSVLVAEGLVMYLRVRHKPFAF